MRNTFKKSFAILLVVCMLFASVPFTASAATVEVATLAELQSALSSGADIIDVTADIQLTASINVSGDVTIKSSNGSSLIRASSYASYMLVVADGGELTLENITINGNRTSYETAQLATEMIVVQTGGVLNFNDGTLLTTNRGNAVNSGGGITVVGTLNINGGSITNIHMHNSSSVTVQYGAAITVFGGTVNMYDGVIGGEGGQNDGRNGAIGIISGTFNMYGGSIDGNVANEQGGGAGGVHISAAGTFNMNGGSVINNNSRRNGGGFYNEGTLNISGGLISGNTATYTDLSDPSLFFGGAIYNTGVLNISAGEISGNTAKSCGGAIYNLGTAVITGGTIDGNASQMYSAGAIFVDGTGTLDISGGFFTNNTAGQFGGAIAVTSSASEALVISGGAFSGNACGASQCGGDIYITTANSSNVNTNYSYECKTYTLYVDNVGSRYSASNAVAATSSVLTAGYGYVFAENGEGHKFGDWVETKAPTCTEVGYQERTCPNCGKVETLVIAALGHSWDDGKVITAATCTTAGEMSYTCTVCGETKTEAIAALGHTAGAITTVAPTCTEAGSSSYTCTVCGVTVTETIAALGHKSTTERVEPTCTGTGYVSVTCSVCGEQLSYTTLAALGHKDGEWVVTKEATRTETGLKELKCAVCGETIDTEIIPLIPDPTITAATVEAAQAAKDVEVPVTFVGNEGVWSLGFYVYYDAALDLNGVLTGDIFEKIITSVYNVDPATDATAAAAFAAAGVSTSGVLCYKVYAEALDLNNIKKDGTVATLVFNLPSSDEYEFVVGIVPVEGLTINNEGTELEYFTNDGAIVIPELDPCDHVAGDWIVTVEATCTAEGTKIQQCVSCGKLMNTATIAATGHAYGEAVETKAPTCTESGVATATCENCGATKTSAIAPVGHAYGEAVETKAPTCTESGVATATCENCGATKTSAIAPVGHSYGNAVETKAPTCTEDGEETATCDKCGATVVAAIPALGHTAGEWIEVVAPGPTTEGLRTKSCTVCGEVLASEVLPATEIAKIVVDAVEAATETEATVDVSVEYNPGVWGMLVYVYYDEALELVAIDNGTVFPEITYEEAVFNMAPDYLDDCVAAFAECGVDAAGKAVTAVYLESADIGDVTADGVILSATFAVPATADVTYEIGVVHSAENVYNANYDNVDFELVSGEIVAREVVCDHEWSDWAVVQEGDCTTNEISERTCGLCGKTETSVVAAPGHAWEDGESKAPTCTEAGFTTQICATCGESVVTNISALGHKAGEWVIDGDIMTQSCTVCGEILATKEVASIPTITADTVSVVVGNGATVPVYLTGNDGFWATRIFVYYDAALELVNVANGAVAADSEITVGDYNQLPGTFDAADEAFAAAGVATDGIKYVAIYFEADELVDITGNGILVSLEFAAAEIGEYAINAVALAADCFNNAEEEITYEFAAGSVNVTEKPACVHVAGDEVVTEATCTTAGKITVSCTICGEILSEETTPALGHKAGDWTIVTEPTTDAAGKKVMACEQCGETILEMTIPALSDVTVYATDATALPGESASVQVYLANNPGVYCTRVVLVYDEALTLTAATAGDLFAGAGEFETSEEFADPAANATLARIFAANNMSTEGVKAVILWFESDALVNQEGDGKLCDLVFTAAAEGVYGLNMICDLPYDAFDVDANDIAVSFEGSAIEFAEAEEDVCDHANTALDADTVVEATCTADGYTGDIICTDCGEVIEYGEVISATGHDEGEWIVVKEATEDEEGLEQLVCNVCGAVLDEKIIDKLEPVVITIGDVNGDGKVNFRDVTMLQLRISSQYTDDDIAAENADVNGDGRINSRDYILLSQYLSAAITYDELIEIHG